MRTSDKDRPERLTTTLARGYLKKLDDLVKTKGLVSRPQVIELLIDSARGKVDFEAKKLRINNTIKELQLEIDKQKEKLVNVNKEEENFLVNQEAEQTKTKKILAHIEKTLRDCGDNKDDLLVRAKQLAVSFNIPFSEVQTIIDKL